MIEKILEEYYQNAESGLTCGDESIVKYINQFDKIILWGASFQGKAIGRKLFKCGVSIDCYWDLRYNEIEYCEGVEVKKPFDTDNRENALVIICIGNRVIHGPLTKELRLNGFNHYIHGDYLYMGLLCPFTIETGVVAKRCSGTMECRQVYCKRIANIMRGNDYSDEVFYLPSVTLIVNQICSLKCKFCTSYMNEYKKQDRINIATEQICEDIDKFFGAVDGVGTITVMGGEPFLHPNLSEIISHLCEWKNFALISIATSGTCKIKKNQLDGLHDDRVNVSFSNYTPTISELQREIFYQNIKLMKENNIQHTVGLYTPQWLIPSTLGKKEFTNEEIIEKKSKCTHWLQIKNGKVHPCDFAQSLYSLQLADYESDYVDLSKYSGNELKKELVEYYKKPFYESCRHHGYINNNRSVMTTQAAQQGYADMKGNGDYVE